MDGEGDLPGASSFSFADNSVLTFPSSQTGTRNIKFTVDPSFFELAPAKVADNEVAHEVALVSSVRLDSSSFLLSQN
jgi:hypothetical protein